MDVHLPTLRERMRRSGVRNTVHVREVGHLSYQNYAFDLYETEMHLMSKISSELAGIPGSALEP